MTHTGPRSHPPAPSQSRRLAALAGLLLLAGGTGCSSDPRPVVVISVAGLTPTVQAIRTTAMLGGQTDVEVFTSGLGQFGLRLPAGTSGVLGLTLEGLRSDQCAIASGSVSVNVTSGQSRVDVTIGLAPLQSPSCGSPDMGGPPALVTVTKSASGTSNGMVTSTPAGISCGTTCSASFASGSKLTLNVIPDYRSLFLGWSGDCTAVEGSCLLTAGAALTATARFTPTSCSLDRICQKLPTPLPATRFRAVWGSSPNNVWVVGASGSIMHWDGALFSPVQSGTTGDLLSVWGSGPNDVWVGGANGLLLRWNGTAFSPVTVGTMQGISSIWGSGPNDVWFVDGTPTLQHFTGNGFTAVTTGSGVSLSAIWGSSANDFWVVAINGNVAHWIGTGFSIGPSSTSSLLTAVWGSSATDVWAVSGVNPMSGYASIIHYDGASWRTISSAIPDFLAGVGVTVGQVWAVGTNGAIWRSSGTTFARQSTGTTSNLNAAFSSGMNDVWAVGDSGVILRQEP